MEAEMTEAITKRLTDLEQAKVETIHRLGMIEGAIAELKFVMNGMTLPDTPAEAGGTSANGVGELETAGHSSIKEVRG